MAEHAVCCALLRDLKLRVALSPHRPPLISPATVLQMLPIAYNCANRSVKERSHCRSIPPRFALTLIYQAGACYRRRFRGFP